MHGPSIASGHHNLAVDGSQIAPNKDYSFGIAAIQVAWFGTATAGTPATTSGRRVRAAAVEPSDGERG